MNQPLYPIAPRSPGHTIICAWCRETLVRGGTTISHGMCPACAQSITNTLEGGTRRAASGS